MRTRTLLLCTALCILTTEFALAQTLTASVIALSGKVEMQNGTEWVALKVGDVVQKGTVISTGFKSEAVLKIQNSNVKLGPLTRMTVEQLASNANKEQSQIFIDCGKVSATVQHAQDKRTDFKVRSPVATASVRGTEFTMFADGTIRTHTGLVSRERASDTRAHVIDTNEASDFVPAKGTSTAFTPTHEVSNERGIPIFAGQQSSTDAVTGKASHPHIEHIAQRQNLFAMPGSIAEAERAMPFHRLNVPQARSRSTIQEESTETSSVYITITYSD